MKNDEIQIDYEYLWDIICTPNEKLFPHGLNLILLAIPDDDIYPKCGCYLSHKSLCKFIIDGRKKTAIILIRDHFYETFV